VWFSTSAINHPGQAQTKIDRLPRCNDWYRQKASSVYVYLLGVSYLLITGSVKLADTYQGEERTNKLF